MEENQKLYGPIGNGRLLDIAVYQNENLLYSGKIEDAPDTIKEKMYKEVILDGNKCKYLI